MHLDPRYPHGITPGFGHHGAQGGIGTVPLILKQAAGEQNTGALLVPEPRELGLKGGEQRFNNRQNAL